MDFEMSESRLLYGLGAFLGIVSIIYFGQELILDLSPTVKAFILLSGTLLFLGAAEYVQHGFLQSSFYVFSAFSYLSFLVYIFLRFQFSSGETFLILAASSAVFLGLGYLRSEKGYGLEQQQAKRVVGVMVAVLAVALVADVAGPQPEYSLELRESLEVAEGEEFQIGNYKVRNDFPLSRNVDIPTFRGCAYIEGERRGLYFNPDDRSLLAGGETISLSLTDTLVSRPDRNLSLSGTYSVVNRECPEEGVGKTIYLSEGRDSSPIELRAKE